MNLTCPICKSDFTGEVSSSYPGDQKNSFGMSHIFFCPECELGIAVPVPSAEVLDEYYDSSGFWGGQVNPISSQEDMVSLEQASSRWRFVRRHSRMTSRDGLKVLDIGGGRGCFGLTCDETVSKYVMVEPDQGMQQVLKEAWGAFGKQADLEVYSSMDEVNDTFDLVVCTHVLEHVTDPLSFIETMGGFLGDGGELFVETPYRDDLFKMEVFPHVLFYNPSNMSLALDAAGFNVVRSETCGASRSVSSLNARAPRRTHWENRLLKKMRGVLPHWLTRKLYSCHFKWDQSFEDGVWIRALGVKRSQSK